MEVRLTLFAALDPEYAARRPIQRIHYNTVKEVCTRYNVPPHYSRQPYPCICRSPKLVINNYEPVILNPKKNGQNNHTRLWREYFGTVEPRYSDHFVFRDTYHIL